MISPAGHGTGATGLPARAVQTQEALAWMLASPRRSARPLHQRYHFDYFACSAELRVRLYRFLYKQLLATLSLSLGPYPRQKNYFFLKASNHSKYLFLLNLLEYLLYLTNWTSVLRTKLRYSQKILRSCAHLQRFRQKCQGGIALEIH